MCQDEGDPRGGDRTLEDEKLFQVRAAPAGTKFRNETGEAVVGDMVAATQVEHPEVDAVPADLHQHAVAADGQRVLVLVGGERQLGDVSQRGQQRDEVGLEEPQVFVVHATDPDQRAEVDGPQVRHRDRLKEEQQVGGEDAVDLLQVHEAVEDPGHDGVGERVRNAGQEPVHVRGAILQEGQVVQPPARDALDEPGLAELVQRLRALALWHLRLILVPGVWRLWSVHHERDPQTPSRRPSCPTADGTEGYRLRWNITYTSRTPLKVAYAVEKQADDYIPFAWDVS